MRVLLAGIGGYGCGYAEMLFDGRAGPEVEIAGVADPFAGNSPIYPRIESAGIPVTDTIQQFHRLHEADLAVISSPIHLHCEHVTAACPASRSILCEKPVGATIQQGLEMIEARDAAGCWLGIGYQWSYSEHIQALKRDIRSGLFGAPRLLKCLLLWPRTEAYYGRAPWAGRKKIGDKWVLDSPVNNAGAHYLHHMFYLLGVDADASANPVSVQAELYRANDIENYDTAALRARLENRAEVLFFATHATKEHLGPVYSFQFEDAVIGNEQGKIEARFNDGRTRRYPEPGSGRGAKLAAAVSAVRDYQPSVCGVEASLPQTLCMNGAQESSGILDFPNDMVVVEGDADERLTWVAGLGEAFRRCYGQAMLPAETGLPWTGGGREVDLTRYRRFPSDPDG